MGSRLRGNDRVTPFSLSFRGAAQQRTRNPLNTDDARLAKFRAHGFPLAQERRGYPFPLSFRGAAQRRTRNP